MKFIRRVYREVPSKVTRTAKTTKFMKIRKTIDKVNAIYSEGCRETLSKVTRIAKITKFTKTVKFTVIRQTSHNINEIYSKGHLQNQQNLFKRLRAGPSKVTKFTKTAKFPIIRKTIDNINKIYSNSCRDGPSNPFLCFINLTSVVTAIFARIC